MSNYARQRGRKPDPIAYTETFQYPGCTVHVHFPDLSDEEHEQRRKYIKQATADFWKETIRREREREKANKQ